MNTLHQSVGIANLPPVFLRDKFDLREEESRAEDVTDVADLQRSQTNTRQIVVDSFVALVFGHSLRLSINPHLAPVLAELRAVRDEEASEEFPITQFAYGTAVTVLVAAIGTGESTIPTPAIAPDGSGGLRIEWARGDRNVRAVIPSRPDQRSFIYHIVGSVSGLDRLSGANLATRLREVIQ